METPCRIEYEPPVVEVVEMESEGIICVSGEDRDPWEE